MRSVFLGFLLFVSSAGLAETAASNARPIDARQIEVRVKFKNAVQAYQKKDFSLSYNTFKEISDSETFLKPYRHWFQAQTAIELGHYPEAERELVKVLASPVSNELKYQSQFLMGDLAIKQNKFKEALARLQPLTRKWRRSYRYADVLSRIIFAQIKLGRRDLACAPARTLYAKAPAHPAVKDWGSDLAQVMVEEHKLGCRESNADFSQRIRSLQLAGESEKAQKELSDRIEKSSGEDKLHLDMVLAQFLVNEGAVEDALNILVRHYPEQKSSVSFLTLLGRAAARAGEYQTAVGALERVYTLDSRSRRGREALFQAAYLSYQFQDYDGAVRKFQKFSKANPNSGLGRDAQWHLAWLQYLRGDYPGALQRLKEARQSLLSKRRTAEGMLDRLTYWMGMSHLRLEQWAEAGQAFDAIMKKTPNSYYGLAAEARLESLKGKIPSVTDKRVPTSLAAVPVETSSEQETESEETMAANAAEDEDAEEEAIQPSEFKDPALRQRIDVAANLTQLGLNELARWELIEVEKRTRNPQYLRLLISGYENLGSYHRSAALAELNFANERETQGLDGARALWLSMYPQAFRPQILAANKKFGVAPEWIWAIMRTESLYKPDVISPVGAKGLLQLMPFTARNLMRMNGEVLPEVSELLDPDLNIRLGAQYLARLSQKFNGHLGLVAAAYNAGPHRVENWLMSFGQLESDEFIEHIPFLETRNYAKKVIRSQALYRRLYGKDLKPLLALAQPMGARIPVRAATRESWDSL